MPLVRIETNLPRSVVTWPVRMELNKMTSELFAVNDLYNCVVIHTDLDMLFSSNDDPCAFVTVESMGKMSPEEVGMYSKEYCQTLKEFWDLDPERIFVSCRETTMHHLGWNGLTQAEHQRIAVMKMGQDAAKKEGLRRAGLLTDEMEEKLMDEEEARYEREGYWLATEAGLNRAGLNKAIAERVEIELAWQAQEKAREERRRLAKLAKEEERAKQQAAEGGHTKKPEEKKEAAKLQTDGACTEKEEEEEEEEFCVEEEDDDEEDDEEEDEDAEEEEEDEEDEEGSVELAEEEDTAADSISADQPTENS